MTTKMAQIIETKGARFPDGHERIYRLRAGEHGRGKTLAEHGARGDWRATDAAIEHLETVAEQLGYSIAES